MSFGGGWGGGVPGGGVEFVGGGRDCMEFVQSVSQVLYHVNSWVVLHAALLVQDRRLLSNTLPNSKIPYPLQIVGTNGILPLTLNL